MNRFKNAFDALFNRGTCTYTPNNFSEYQQFLYDFQNFHSGFSDIVDSSELESEAFSDGTYGEQNGYLNKKKKSNQKLQAKPIDVQNELEKVPNPFSLEGLDVKIALLKSKIELSKNKIAKRELSGMVICLENRKKYTEHKLFFDNYQTTTQESIDNLLKKYELVMKESDIFIPEFPQEAIDIMKKYTEVVLTITTKKPNFYVIATSDNFKQVDKKRDPILLAQSPFGFFWYILGAWDKEMIILNEL